jgi:hypothetical protein
LIGDCQRRDKTVQLWRHKSVQFYLRLLPNHTLNQPYPEKL